ncbi:MAG: hypothetical protein LBS68_02620 [Puniceicoccales bacterium]|jgi:hypothetical protein|nr:hypothetical protein [Puniceicoccales bacterium]
MAYLVLAGAVVTLLAPLKIIGCSVALLSNYAYSPVTIILTGLMLLLQKIGWMKRVSDPGVLSTAGKCIFLVAFWPSYISGKMAECTTAKEQSNSTVYLHKLHFLQMKLMVSLFDLKSEEEQPKEESSEEESPGGGMFVGVG